MRGAVHQRMPRPLLWFSAGQIYEVTSRTIQARFLLRPDAGTREIINGVIARAQELYPAVSLFTFGFLSNHMHMQLASQCGQQMVLFIGYVKRRLSTELGRVHGWSGSMWAGPPRYIAIVDDASIIGRFLYILAHGVKEGLVASPRDWPGASPVAGLLGNMRIAARVFDRDRETRSRRRGKAQSFARNVTLVLTPLPPWAWPLARTDPGVLARNDPGRGLGIGGAGVRMPDRRRSRRCAKEATVLGVPTMVPA